MNDGSTDKNEKPRRTPRSRVASALMGLAMIYCGLLLLLYLLQAKLIFFPTRDFFVPSELYTWNYEDVFVTVGKYSTHGWFVPAADEANGTILFSHGNAGNIADRSESIGLFRELGYNVFIYDYGGYGRTSGKASEERCYEDIRAAWRYLTEERGIAPSDIVLFGRSLGGGPTAQLATEVQPRAVILESTFTSVADMASQQFPMFPARLLVRHEFDTISKVPRITAPILHIHSPEDDIIPYAHGQRLFEASTEPKTFLNLKGTHNLGYLLTGEPYINGLKTFLDATSKPPA